MDIYDDALYIGTTGTARRAEAQGLASRISTFKFIVQLITWYNILFEINITSKMLQDKNLNINSALQQLKHTRKFLSDLRSDLSFGRILVDCVDLAKSNGFPTELDSEPVRIRRKKKQFSYEGTDEPIDDPKQRFKVEFYFAVIDTAIMSVDERFQQMFQLESTFGVLYSLHHLKNQSSENTLKACNGIEEALRHNNSKDIDGNDLFVELQSFCKHFNNSTTPEEALKYICLKNLSECFPNIFIILRILLTLPISVASAERSFSKLKLIKNYLRTTMTQNRLTGLATLSIEEEISSSLDVSNLIKDFAKLKARKVNV